MIRQNEFDETNLISYKDERYEFFGDQYEQFKQFIDIEYVFALIFNQCKDSTQDPVDIWCNLVYELLPPKEMIQFNDNQLHNEYLKLVYNVISSMDTTFLSTFSCIFLGKIPQALLQVQNKNDQDMQNQFTQNAQNNQEIQHIKQYLRFERLLTVDGIILCFQKTLIETINYLRGIQIDQRLETEKHQQIIRNFIDFLKTKLLQNGDEGDQRVADRLLMLIKSNFTLQNNPEGGIFNVKTFLIHLIFAFNYKIPYKCKFLATLLQNGNIMSLAMKACVQLYIDAIKRITNKDIDFQKLQDEVLSVQKVEEALMQIDDQLLRELFRAQQKYERKMFQDQKQIKAGSQIISYQQEQQQVNIVEHQEKYEQQDQLQQQKQQQHLKQQDLIYYFSEIDQLFSPLYYQWLKEQHFRPGIQKHLNYIKHFDIKNAFYQIKFENQDLTNKTIQTLIQDESFKKKKRILEDYKYSNQELKYDIIQFLDFIQIIKDEPNQNEKQKPYYPILPRWQRNILKSDDLRKMFISLDRVEYQISIFNFLQRIWSQCTIYQLKDIKKTIDTIVVLNECFENNQLVWLNFKKYITKITLKTNETFNFQNLLMDDIQKLELTQNHKLQQINDFQLRQLFLLSEQLRVAPVRLQVYNVITSFLECRAMKQNQFIALHNMKTQQLAISFDYSDFPKHVFFDPDPERKETTRFNSLYSCIIIASSQSLIVKKIGINLLFLCISGTKPEDADDKIEIKLENPQILTSLNQRYYKVTNLNECKNLRYFSTERSRTTIDELSEMKQLIGFRMVDENLGIESISNQKYSESNNIYKYQKNDLQDYISQLFQGKEDLYYVNINITKRLYNDFGIDEENITVPSHDNLSYMKILIKCQRNEQVHLQLNNINRENFPNLQFIYPVPEGFESPLNEENEPSS